MARINHSFVVIDLELLPHLPCLTKQNQVHIDHYRNGLSSAAQLLCLYISIHVILAIACPKTYIYICVCDPIFIPKSWAEAVFFHIEKCRGDTYLVLVFASPTRTHFLLLGVAAHCLCIGDSFPQCGITKYHSRPSPFVLRNPKPTATYFFFPVVALLKGSTHSEAKPPDVLCCSVCSVGMWEV